MPFAAVFQLTDLGRWRQWGGLGVFVAGAVNTSVLPIPGLVDALTLLMAAANQPWWPYYAALATAGSLAGGMVSYEVGRKGGKNALEKKFGKQGMNKVYGRFDRWGFGAVFVPAVLPPPFPVMPFLLGAGALDYSLKKFLLALGLGRAVRFTAVALLGSIYGRQILGFFSRYYEPILYMLVALAVAGGIVALVFYLRYRRQRRQKAERPRKAA